jgi:hypothetical protein
LNPDGTVLRERVLPDAASDIVEGNGLWVAGCRNNWVYAYSVDGEQVWHWRMPPDESSGINNGAGVDRIGTDVLSVVTRNMPTRRFGRHELRVITVVLWICGALAVVFLVMLAVLYFGK